MHGVSAPLSPGLLQAEVHGNDNVSLNLWMRRGEMEALGQECVAGAEGRLQPGLSVAGSSLIPLLIPDVSGCAEAAPSWFCQIPREGTLTQTCWDFASKQNIWFITAGTFGCASWARSKGRTWDQPSFYPLYN